jgi:DNA-binding transcriptional ArsR family regulator
MSSASTPRRSHGPPASRAPACGGAGRPLGAVADPTRRRLLDVLLAHGEASATTLAGELPVSRQAIVKHLAVLDRVGLVAGKRRGREVLYTVEPTRLDAIKRLAEAERGRKST